MKDLNKQSESEMGAMQNALNYYYLNGYKVSRDYSKLRRLQYFLHDNEGTSLAGSLNYTEMNNFIRGYGKAYQKFGYAINRKLSPL